MPGRPPVFFSPAAYPGDEEARQAAVDRSGYARAAADPRLRAIVEQAAAIFGAPSAAISIIDRDRQNWFVRTGLEEDGTARALSFCGHVVAEPGRVLVVKDAAADARFAGIPLVAGPLAAVRFYAGAALMDGDMPLGALCAVADRPATAEISDAQAAKLRALADQVIAILRDHG